MAQYLALTVNNKYGLSQKWDWPRAVDGTIRKTSLVKN